MEALLPKGVRVAWPNLVAAHLPGELSLLDALVTTAASLALTAD
jgi:hypothetical protein